MFYVISTFTYIREGYKVKQIWVLISVSDNKKHHKSYAFLVNLGYFDALFLLCISPFDFTYVK